MHPRPTQIYNPCELDLKKIQNLIAESQTTNYTNVQFQCPYEPKSHYLTPARFSNHLADCRRNHACTSIASCRFNDYHRVERTKLAMHESNCPDRIDSGWNNSDVKSQRRSELTQVLQSLEGKMAKIQMVIIKKEVGGLPITAEEERLLRGREEVKLEIANTKAKLARH